MKKSFRWISFLLCLIFLAAGAHFPASAESVGDTSGEAVWYAELTAQYETLLPDLGARRAEWDEELAACTAEEARIMRYYFVTMPMSDVVGLDYALLHRYATHAAMLRETSDYAKSLSEDAFLCYVASYRVDYEPIEDCRAFFYGELCAQLQGKTLEEAALLVNLWCGEQATYAESDQRAASPMGMYNGGYGRCGEESNFVVNVMRSVGIPARVCNVDWTTVLGGHAFVEVLIDGAWRYLGACEPEAVLDSAWFVGRLGTLLYTSSYSASPIGVQAPYVQMPPFSVVNNIAAYVPAKEVTIAVLDADGHPAADCAVDLIYTQLDAYPVQCVRLTTDEAGNAAFELGFGSVAAVAYLDGDFRAAWIAADETQATLSFAEAAKEDVWMKLPIAYSQTMTENTAQATDAEKAAFFGDLDVGATREANRTGAYDADKAANYPTCEAILATSGRNFDELYAFLSADDDPMRAALVAALTDKDAREVTSDVLTDLLRGAQAVRGGMSDEDFIEGLLAPVFDWTCPSAHRLAVQAMFSEEELAAFREDPASLYAWFCDHIGGESVRDYQGRTPNLLAVLKSGYCPADFQWYSLMELARTVGIPVKTDVETDAWFHLSEGEWASVDAWFAEEALPESGEAATGTIAYRAEGSEAFLDSYWTIARTAGDAYELVSYWFVEAQDADTSLVLPAGKYFMWLTHMTEETSGTLYFRQFTLEAGETMPLSLPEE